MRRGVDTAAMSHHSPGRPRWKELTPQQMPKSLKQVVRHNTRDKYAYPVRRTFA